MFKGTIQLKDGTTVQVECESATEFGGLLGQMNNSANIASVTSNEVRLTDTQLKPLNIPTKSSTWGQKDVLIMAKALSETGGAYGTAKDVVSAIRLNGENKKRTAQAIMVMAGYVGRYLFDGKVNSSGLPKHAIEILKVNGYKPGTVNRILKYPAHAQRVAATRAKTRTRKYHTHLPWTPRDVVAIAQIVKENIHVPQGKGGLSQFVARYVAEQGDTKHRTNSTIYTITSEIKKHLQGDSKATGKKIGRILNNAGFTVGSVMAANTSPIEA